MSLSDDVKNLEASLGVARQQRDDARAALAKITAERDTARDELRLATERHAKERDTTTWADPTKWRGPHGEPREDDVWRMRVAAIDGDVVLLTTSLDSNAAIWEMLGRDGDADNAPTLAAACAAADAYVAGLAKKVGRVFTVERSRTQARHGHGGWICDTLNTGFSTASFVARQIVFSCGGNADDDDDFVLDHAALFRDGGTITESEVRAWIAARGTR